MRRYEKSTFFINNSDKYQEIFEQKKIAPPVQYFTFDFKNLSKLYELDLDITLHTVQKHDKLYMLSQKYYKDPSYGWVICYTNQKSSELDINTGDILRIYFPLDNILELF